MANLKKLSILAAGIIVLGAGVFPASAQYRDRDYDRDRDRDRRGGFSLRGSAMMMKTVAGDVVGTAIATTRPVVTVTVAATGSFAASGSVKTIKV
jgi:hypothetical protein